MNALLEISGLTSHYGRIQALKGVDVTVNEGELVALVGANGAGKTTFLRCVSGVQRTSGGTIRFADEDITALSPAARVSRRITQSPEGRQVFGPMSVLDNLRLGAYRRRDTEIASDIEEQFEMFPMLRDKQHLPAATLSGGQQQMLAIARALMGRPRILLLDEPSMGLAPLLVAEIFQTLVRLKKSGVTIFLVEQNVFAALGVADRGYVISTGSVVLSDTGEALLANQKIKEAYLGQ